MRCLYKAIFVLILCLLAFGCGDDGVKLTKIEKAQYEAIGIPLDEAKLWKNSGFVFTDAHQWKSGGFIVGEALKWKESGFTLQDARQWKSNEFTIENATKWKGYGLKTFDAIKWAKSGINYEEAQSWMNEGFEVRYAEKWKIIASNLPNTKKLLEAGFERNRPDDALCFKDRGFQFDDIIKLKKFGFRCRDTNGWKQARFGLEEMILLTVESFRPSNYSSAKSWKDIGFSADEINRLRKSGFGVHNYHEAKKYKNEGFKIDDIVLLKKAKIDSYEALRWRDTGFSLNQAISLQKANFDYRYAEAWKKEGFTIDKTLQFSAIGFRRHQATKAKDWNSTGLSISEIRTALKNDFKVDQPQDYVAYQKLGLQTEEILSFKKAGYSNYEVKKTIDSGVNKNLVLEYCNADWKMADAIGWIHASVNPELASQWKKAGYSHGECKRLKENNISIDEISRWEEAGYKNLEAKKWLLSGIKFDEAQKWEKVGYNAEQAKMWTAAGVDIETIPNLNTEEKAVYLTNFHGVTLGMDEMEAVKRLDDFANKSRFSRRGGFIVQGNLVLATVQAENSKVNYLAYHPKVVDIPYNEWGMDTNAANKYILDTFGIQLDQNNEYDGKKLEIKVSNFLLGFWLK